MLITLGVGLASSSPRRFQAPNRPNILMHCRRLVRMNDCNPEAHMCRSGACCETIWRIPRDDRAARWRRRLKCTPMAHVTEPMNVGYRRMFSMCSAPPDFSGPEQQPSDCPSGRRFAAAHGWAVEQSLDLLWITLLTRAFLLSRLSDQPGRSIWSRRCKSSFTAGVGADLQATSR
jgi:hypothetical protein